MTADVTPPDLRRLAAAREALVHAEAAARAGESALFDDASVARAGTTPDAESTMAHRTAAPGSTGAIGRRRSGEDRPDDRRDDHPLGDDESGEGREPRPDREPRPEDVARQIVLRQLAMGPRSRHQLEKKLAERGCDSAVAERVLDRMADVGLVDDKAFAEMLVRSKQQTRGLATKALAQELRTKGIDKDVADAALGAVSRGDEHRRAVELAEKKLRSMHGLPAETQARRLAGMLGRKGYAPSLVYQVVRDVVADAPEHRRD